jgi:mono/diheme cytochrome c family protein
MNCSRIPGVTGATALLALCVSISACQGSPREDVATQWRSDCPPAERPEPLSVEAARAAHRRAALRHTMRLREAANPGSTVRRLHTALDPSRMARGDMCLADIADLGELVFEHEYGLADGLGGGERAASARGPFRRVHGGAFGGPETISCTSCHWVGGPNGAGAETDNAFLIGEGESIASADARNPQALAALGVVQALAREMSAELQKQRANLVRAGKPGEARLTAKGVDFGVLRVGADGKIDTAGVHGVDPDLVVKPFGWKGNFDEIADFTSDALQVHLGIQSDVLLVNGNAESYGAGADRADRDGDGVRDELRNGPFTAMVAHLALLEMPIVAPLVQKHDLGPAATGLIPPTTTSFAEDFARGRHVFRDIGCADCHRPMMVLNDPIVSIDGLPPINLADSMRPPGLVYDEALGGYPVWLFSDLKRHDMGALNEAQHLQRGVPLRDYLTPRLWGVADSAPYLHDGRAPSFDYAIAGHDGEGAAARAAFTALALEEQGALRVYLMSLRRAPRLIVP